MSENEASIHLFEINCEEEDARKTECTGYVMFVLHKFLINGCWMLNDQ